MKNPLVWIMVILLAFCGGDKNTTPAGDQQEAGMHSGEQEGTPPGETAEPAEHEHQELLIPPEKQEEWGIVVGTAEKRPVSTRLTLPGVLTLNQNRTARITSYVSGKVVSLNTDLGKRVSKGQVLLTINSPEYGRAQADFLRARAAYLLSRKEYERARKLFQAKAIEEKEYLRREAEHEKLATEYGALGSALHSYGITHEQIDALIEKCRDLEDAEYKCEVADPFLPILSPISGTVIFRDVVIGENVDAEKTLFQVSDLGTLWALLDAYEKDLPFLRENSPVTILSSLYPEKAFPGRTVVISDVIDEKLRTVQVRAEVNNAEGLLRPNMYIQGVLEGPVRWKEALSVPEDAVQNFEGEKIVFVLEEENVFAVRHIQEADRVGGRVIVAGGLEAGDRFVVKGAFYLKAELSKEKFGHAHVH